MSSVAQQIEAVLFWKAEPVSKKKLSEWLSMSTSEVDRGLAELEAALTARGIAVMYKDDEVMLSTKPALSELITRLAKEELNRELGKAGLETLSVVLYFGPLSRSEIDYIRGVNSSFIVRALLIRGLVERVAHERDQRSFLYRPTFELLSFLGISRVTDMPDYETARTQLKAFREAQAEQDAVEQEKEKEVS